jgi:hypothetical protein
MPEPLPYIKEGDWLAVQQQTDQLNRFLVGMGGDNILSVPHCIVRRNAAFTITANTANIVIPWDTEVSDPHNMISVTSNNIRVPFSGIYHVYAQASVVVTGAPGGVWTWQGHICINGTAASTNAPIGRILGASGVAFTYVNDCSMPMKLIAGDTISLGVFQNAGANYDTSTGAGFHPMMAVSFLGNYS